MKYVVSNSTQHQRRDWWWGEEVRRRHSCGDGGKESRSLGLLRRQQDHPDSLSSSFATGAGSEHGTDDKETAELPFCISVHKICDEPLNTINISRWVESRAEQLKGMLEDG